MKQTLSLKKPFSDTGNRLSQRLGAAREFPGVMPALTRLFAETVPGSANERGIQ
jgi:hypothetical protein